MALGSFSLLPPDRFAQVMDLDPIAFNGAVVSCSPRASSSDVWWQTARQANGRLSVDGLVMALAEAERQIEQVVGFPLAPRWIEGEQVALERQRRTLPHRARQGGIPLGLKNGRFIEVGKRKLAVVATDVAVVYSDEDGDGYNETATITVVGQVGIEPCQVRVMADSGELVRPLTAVIDGDDLVITGKTHLFINPTIRQTATEPVDLCDIGNLLTTVDVYREYADPSGAAVFTYLDESSVCLGDPTCTLTINSNACIYPRRAEAGRVRARGRDLPEDPVAVQIWYRAGASGCQENGRILLERAVAYLAIANTSDPVCPCKGADERFYRLRVNAADEENKLIYNQVDLRRCPFGTQVGHLEAWRLVELEMGTYDRHNRRH